MTVAVYPGSFDPITNGHLDVIKRSKKLFDRLFVSVVCNYSKKSLFTKEERVDIIKTVLMDNGLTDNVIIEGFEGLLINYVKEKHANVIVRGLRAVTDFEYEFAISQMNRHLNSEIDTVFLMANEQYSFISSNMIKEVAMLGGDISSQIHPYVLIKLKEKFNL